MPDQIDPIKSAQSKLTPRDLSGKFSKVDPPLVSFSVTNPVTYLRKWWKAVMDGEGVDIRLKVHPFTAVAITFAIGGVSFGVGRFSVPEPFSQYLPIFTPDPSPTLLPTSTPVPWREAAFVGVLQKQQEKFFLIGNDSQAVLLEVPGNVNLNKYVGKEILASGKYNAELRLLQVTTASDLEVITGTQPVATVVPTPTITPTLPPSATPTASPEETSSL